MFQCDAKHSCDNDHLVADFYSLYATDQIDLTDRWKLRVGVRQDWYNTELDPLITVPGRFTSTGVPLIAGVPQTRNDSPVSWNVGTLYKLYPGNLALCRRLEKLPVKLQLGKHSERHRRTGIGAAV